MLVVSVRLLHGTIRAGSPHDVVMAGGAPVGEWPPSPARVFSALVAGDGTRDRQRFTDGSELRRLESAPPPVIIADSFEQVEGTALLDRYVVEDARAPGIVQNYPARKATLVHPGVRMSPRSPGVHYLWDVDLSESELVALRTRADRVGYLGCSDSPVQVVVSTSDAVRAEGLDEWHPGASSGIDLPVPYTGFVDALDWAFDAWSGGEAMRRAWIPNQWERYGIAADQAPPEQAEVIWLSFDRRLPGRRALPLAEVIRSALLEQSDRMSARADLPAGRRAPWVLHGHAIPSDVERPYQLARVLPLLDVGSRHSTGAIHGAAVWLPPTCDAATVELLRAAAQRINVLRGPGVDVRVRPHGGEALPRASAPTRWIGPAARWFSATPVVVERGRRHGPTAEDVKSWFAHAGHPVPSSVEMIAPVPTRPGVERLRPHEVHRRGHDRHPFFWIEVRFEVPVEGPLCVGRSRSFGLGLMAPHLAGGVR